MQQPKPASCGRLTDGPHEVDPGVGGASGEAIVGAAAEPVLADGGAGRATARACGEQRNRFERPIIGDMTTRRTRGEEVHFDRE